MRTSHVVPVVVGAALLLALPAQAQIARTSSVPDRSFELGVGLALNGINNVNEPPLCERLAYPCTGAQGLPDTGVAVAFAGMFHEVFGLVFDIGVYKERWTAPDGYRPGPGPQTNSILSLTMGPRVSLPATRRTRVFGQVLIGARMSNAVEGSNVVQPGAGLDVRTPVGLKLRFQVDHAIMRGAPPGPRSIGGTRTLIGMVVPIPH